MIQRFVPQLHAKLAALTLSALGSLALAQAATPQGLQALYNQHYTAQSGINSSNAKSLQLAWKFPVDSMISATPLVQDGTVYFTDWDGNAYAVNAQNGQQVWKSHVEEPKKEWPWHGLAGSGALGGGMFFAASVEGEAFALDQQSGKVLWKTKVTDQPNAGNLSKLLYHDGLVYLGLQSIEEPLSKKKPGFQPNFQGHVMALDAKTGKVVWDMRLVDPPKNGVAVWSSFALDPKTSTLFFDTGNNYTGDPSDLSDSLVAVDAKTGQMKWHTQVTPDDVWVKANQQGPDYDFGAGPQFFTAYIKGQPRVLVGAGQKNGYYSVFDAVTGEHVWSQFVGYASVGGGIRGEAAIGNGKILEWSNNNYLDGHDPTKFPITVKAIDPNSGKTLWYKDKTQPAVGWSAGYMANDVYFVGSLDGSLKAYNTMNGDVVWSGKVPSAVGSSLVVSGDTLFVGAGVPKMFAGGPTTGNGLYAFKPAK